MKQKLQVQKEETVEIEGTYEEFLEDLNEKYQSMVSQGLKHIKVCYGHDETVELSGTRWETDEEFNTRISKETKNNENRKNNLKLALKNFSKDCPEEFKELMKEI